MDNAIFEKLKDSLSEFIRIPSERGEAEENAPCGLGVRRALDYILNLSRNLGFTKTVDIDGYIGYAECGEGEECFGILGHVDVVPPGEGWTCDPWGGEIKNGKIYGRGALDDKGPMLASLYAIYALLQEGYEPKCRIRAIFGCDEETGGNPKISGWESIDRYMEKEKLPDIGISPDADFPVINAEKGILNVAVKIPVPEGLLVAEGGTALNIVPNRARLEIKKCDKDFPVIDGVSVALEKDRVVVSATGKNAHAAHADKGDNAIMKAINYLSKVVGGEYTYIGEKLSDVFGSGLNIDVSDNESGKLTQNVGKIEIKDDKLILWLNIRYPVTVKAEWVVDKIAENWKGEVEARKPQEPLFVPQDHYLVKTLLESYNTVMGENAEPIAIGGGTYARALPCGVAFGALFPEQEDSMHSPDECVELKYLYKSCEIYYDAFKKLCFKKK